MGEGQATLTDTLLLLHSLPSGPPGVRGPEQNGPAQCILLSGAGLQSAVMAAVPVGSREVEPLNAVKSLRLLGTFRDIQGWHAVITSHSMLRPWSGRPHTA